VPYLSPPLEDDGKNKGGEEQISSLVETVEGGEVVGVVASSFVVPHFSSRGSRSSSRSSGF